jgi:hypothetical protein
MNGRAIYFCNMWNLAILNEPMKCSGGENSHATVVKCSKAHFYTSPGGSELPGFHFSSETISLSKFYNTTDDFDC